MKPEERDSLAEHILGLADDELILGHRNSEWTGHAPILEEDIAFANIALDEIGHATLWYQIVAELKGADPETYPDEMVFFRSAEEFRNVRMVELPKGDWAFSMLRQYLFDAAEAVRLAALPDAGFEPIAQVARKIRTEEIYHLRHSRAWIQRLGLGTDESNSKLQSALDQLFPQGLQVFERLPGESELEGNGLLPGSDSLRMAWLADVTEHLEDSGLNVPSPDPGAKVGRKAHSEHIEPLVSEMQEVARSEVDAAW